MEGSMKKMTKNKLTWETKIESLFFLSNDN